MDVRQYVNQVYRVAPLVLLVAAFVVLASQTDFSKFFPIRQVRVYGANHVNHKAVESLLRPYVNHGFFRVDVEFIRDRLEQMPWISAIFVKRHWPDAVEVALVEKQAVARWNGENLLSSNGEIFAPSKTTWPTHIPTFVGPEGMHLKMMAFYQAIDRLLEPLHANISYLELTPYATWKLKMTNGLILRVGMSQPLTHLSHFVKVYPKIIGSRVEDVAYVDLRYSNGVAVQWKEPKR